MSESSSRKSTPVYVVVNMAIRDAQEYRKYEKGFFPFLKKHGGSFITYDDTPETVEGDAPLQGRVVLFKFPTEEHFRNWWADPEYQALSEHRREGCRMRFVTLVHGLPPRS